MKISSLLCFSFICVLLEARPDEYNSTSETENESVEKDSPTTEITNEKVNHGNNVERDGRKEETTELPILLNALRSENDDYTSDNASDSGLAEIKDYDNDEQIIPGSSKNIESTEIIQREGSDGESNENKEVRRNEADSKENVSEIQYEEYSEEDPSELEQPALLENTRRMISYPTEKPVDVVTRPGDIAGQDLESRTALGLNSRIPRLPIPMPKLISTAGLPSLYPLTTPIPYLNPIKIQNYPNAATYFKRSPFHSYNGKSLSGMPFFPKSEIPRQGTSLIDDFAVDPYGNAYPLISSTQTPLEIFPQDVFPKNLYSKLMQASEHPVQYRPGLYNPFRNTGYPNANFFLGQKDLKLRPHTLKRNL